LDFEKIYFESEKFDSDPKEKYHLFVDYLVELFEKRADTQNCPVITFRKTNKSPELTDKEYNKVSILSYELWTLHTSKSEQFEIWFNIFNPYYRVKLWNRLRFSEDYTIGIFVNSPELCRKDISLKLTIIFAQIRERYIEWLNADFEKHSPILSRTFLGRRALSKKKQYLDNVKSGQVKLEDAVKKAPQEVRDEFLTEELHL
jgi:hypothetical protein